MKHGGRGKCRGFREKLRRGVNGIVDCRKRSIVGKTSVAETLNSDSSHVGVVLRVKD